MTATKRDRGAAAKDDQALIAAAIESAGTSARIFSEYLMGRDERTIRRWSSGDVGIPPKARAWLERWLELSAPTRTRIVGALLAR